MAFSPRLTKPAIGSKYYTVADYGGTNYGGYLHYVILGKGENGNPVWPGSALPNCVGYCWGRALEILGTTDDSTIDLSTYSAKYWYGHSDKYKRGKTPKLGAIGCWDNGKSGHVAVVEQINPDGSCITSNSYYGHGWPESPTWHWWEKAIIKPSNGYRHPYLGDNTFQGFIYLIDDSEIGPVPMPGPDPHPDINPKNSKFPWVLYHK